MSGQTFQADVEQAIDELRREQPAIFADSPGGTLVASPGRFYVGIIGKLDKKGICGGFDSEELQVKSSNAFNDQFALRTSSGYLRSGPSIYRATCFPAHAPRDLRFQQPSAGLGLARGQ
ncbi:MAG: hypothetical protein DMF78_13490 [Acidobacteria bacterium]|nr:MAG: hypothetical protein DMF78_13490 [Acidobacteriota bacterium]